MTQFVDQVSITVRSGDGGNGIVAWRREKYEPLGGPAGGDGGAGGNVIFQADGQMSTLLDFRYRQKYEAAAGERGGPKNKYGRRGADLVIKVPVGTVIRDLDTKAVVADLVADGQQVLLAEGGRGGRGNTKMVSPTRRAPHFCEPGQPGIERHLELELKLLADVGLVGLPNAGKSTLLSVLTAATPKVGDYPFTTLVPNLGVMKRPDGDGYVVADIPGLVEGASQGTGLGDKFLRHIERTRLIVHVADLSAAESLPDNLAIINKELGLYSERLSRLPQLLVLNKADLLAEGQIEPVLASLAKVYGSSLPGGSAWLSDEPLTISCATRQGVDKLYQLILQCLAKLAPVAPLYEVVQDEGARLHADSGFTVERRKNKFYISGDRVERQVAVTDLRDPESVAHLHYVLKAMGVIDQLLAAGVRPGQEVFIGQTNFAFGEDW